MLRCCVFEFQWQARGTVIAKFTPQAARPYADCLSAYPTDNTCKYKGAIDGKWVSIEALVGVWETNNYRSPLAFELWRMGTPRTCVSYLVHQDKWDSTARAKYFSSHYKVCVVDILANADTLQRLQDARAVKATHPEKSPPELEQIFQPNGSTYCREVVGHYARYPKEQKAATKQRIPSRFRGMTDDAADSAVEFLPVFSPNPNPPRPASPPDSDHVFRVLRAVADVESYGYVDCVQTYDSAFLSFGLIHWTFAREEKDSAGDWNTPDKGMLPSTLREEMLASGGPHLDMLKNTLVTTDTDTAAIGFPAAKDVSLDDFESFRTWYWAYRFRSVARNRNTRQDSATTQANALYNRLTNFLDKPLPATNLWPAGTKYKALATSELSAALLFRMQVNFLRWPNDAVKRAAKAFAKVYPAPPWPWTQTQHDLFCRILVTQVQIPAERPKYAEPAAPTIARIAQWPFAEANPPEREYVPEKRLDTAINSFP